MQIVGWVLSARAAHNVTARARSVSGEGACEVGGAAGYVLLSLRVRVSVGCMARDGAVVWWAGACRRTATR